MITTIIFDMDGVLIDLCQLHRDTFKRALFTHIGLDISDEYHDKHLNGLPTKIKLKKIGISGETALYISHLKQKFTLEALENITIDNDLNNTLWELSKEYSVFCASNSVRQTVEKVLNKLEITKYFTNFFGNDDVFYNKPSPEMYYKCMVNVGARPSQTLAIEDSEIGEQTIKNSGVHGLIVKNRSEVILDRIYNKIKEIENVQHINSDER